MTARRDDGRLRGWRAGLVWAVLGLDLALVLGVQLAAGAGPDTPAFVPPLFATMVASLGGVGALVATRKPRDPVGWILLVSASMVTLSVSGEDYARLSVTDFGGMLPLTVAMAWLHGLVFLPAVVLIAGVMPLYFPDGRLLSRRWRWIVWLAAFGIVVGNLPWAFDPGPLANTTIDNPIGIPGFHDFDGLLTLGNIVIFVVLPLAIASSVLKYRRGSPTIREQLKWFAAVALFTVTSFTAAVVGIAPINVLGWLLGLVGIVLLPVAIAIAILRYRLYDIDRIISRTISYGLITALLISVFLLVNLGLQSLLSSFTSGNSLAVAGSTLLAAALFTPVRRRIQGIVDRRFDRARYDGERTASAFSVRMRDATDLPTVAQDLDLTVRRAIAPSSVGLWLRGGGR